MNKIIESNFKPTVNVAINKSRLKSYKNKLNSDTPIYYLEDGQEFQIEIFNPKTNNVLAEIHMDGKPISMGGIVIRPGERIWLERYLDKPNKLKFKTYSVNNTKEVKDAIVNNGIIEIKFYNEFIINKPIYKLYDNYNNLCDNFHINYNNSGSGTSTFDKNFQTSSIDVSNITIGNNTFTYSKSIETGRVEIGSKSNQSFVNSNIMFEITPFITKKCKLLPISQKIITNKDINIKRYCTECGTKQKKGYKYCPNCGNKL